MGLARRSLKLLFDSLVIMGRTKNKNTYLSRIGVCRKALAQISEMTSQGIAFPEYSAADVERLLTKLAEDEKNAATICAARTARKLSGEPER